MSDRPRVHGGGEAGGLGPLPRRVREHVEVGERQLRDDGDGLVEVPVALTGEPRDHVGAETEVRDRRGEALDDPPIHRRGVRPSHASQDAIASALERDMEVRRHDR